MIRRFLRKYLPSADKIKSYKALALFNKYLHMENLWYINRHTVARAFAIGLFCTWMPLPAHMAMATIGAILFQANLPISVVLVWLANPFTMPILYFFGYWLGCKIIGLELVVTNFELSWQWLFDTCIAIWKPLFLGCTIAGLLSAILAYFMIHRLWRWMVARSWQARKNNIQIESPDIDDDIDIDGEEA